MMKTSMMLFLVVVAIIIIVPTLAFSLAALASSSYQHSADLAKDPIPTKPVAAACLMHIRLSEETTATYQ